MKFIKKYIRLIVLIITCLLIFIIYNNNDKKTINYISLGDGFAVGLNSYEQKDFGYSYYLKNYFESNDKLNKYYDFSYKDIMIKDLYKDILIDKKNNKREILKQALRNSNLLTLSIGINDLIYKKSLIKDLTETKKRQIIKEIVKNLDKTIIEIKKYYKKDIYIIGYYNFYPQNSVESSLIDNLNIEYKKLSTKNKYKFIEVEKIINRNSEYLENPNSFYPNTKGYHKICQKILEKIPF